MRNTIIGVFAVVVLIVSILSLALFRATLGDVSNKGEAQRAVTAAVAQLQVEGLRIERWLVVQANIADIREPFKAGSAKARSESATTACNSIEQRSKNDATFASIRPTLIVLFDAKGIVLGRNGSNLMRGAKLGDRHPELLKTIQAGNTGSSVWVDKQHNEQMLASYAPIRDAGEIIGGVAVGTAFNDERLNSTSEATSQIALFAAAMGSDGIELVAKSSEVTAEMLAGLSSAEQAFDTDSVTAMGGLAETLDGASKSLAGYGNGKQAVIVAATEAHNANSLASLIWAALGVLALGLFMVAVGAHLIDQYISQPISDLEDGLLAVINGETGLRFELEHKVLGGLVFRVNSLLNQLLGVQEDDTDEQGRPSMSPSSSSFTAALNVDERMVSLSLEDVEDGASLRDEAPEDYYKRIFDEYVAAKSEVGDPVDHLKFAHFSRRIKGLEQQLTSKHGKAFRYMIEAKGKDVVFVAVPLS